MIDLLSLIREDNIIELGSAKIEDNARQLIRVCLPDLSEQEQEGVYRMLNIKKRKKPINLSKGFALLHQRLEYIKNLRLAVGIPPEPIKNGRREEIHAIFSIFIPDTNCRTYLSLMAHLTRLLSQPEAKKVFTPGNKRQIIEFVRYFEQAQ